MLRLHKKSLTAGGDDLDHRTAAANQFLEIKDKILPKLRPQGAIVNAANCCA
jgi:hypothetical protein